MNRSFLIILLILVWVSCSKKEDELIPDIKKFPTAAGTHWIYDRLLIIKEFESETLGKIINTDTIFQKFEVWVEKDTLLHDSLNVIVFKTRDNNQSYTSSVYRYFDGDGLKTYAYSNPGMSNETKNGALNLPSVPLILTSQHQTSMESEIIVEEIPLLDVRLPLKSRYSWIYKHSTINNPLQIIKYVSGAETLMLDKKEYISLKISWQYQNDPLFNGIKMTEWISDLGFMKVSTAYPRNTMVNQTGEPIGYYQLTDVLILNEIISP
jgi:hypothetical protein